MHRLVPALVAEMGAAYPELVRAQPLIEATLQQEETRFRQTLANGLQAARRGDRGHGRGRHAARRDRLQALRHLRLPLRPDRGRACAPAASAVDRAGFDAAMAEQKAAARAAWKGSGDKASDELWFDIAEEHRRDRIHRLFRPRRRGRGPRAGQGRRARRRGRARARRHRRPQPDALLRRERRTDRRRRKTDFAQGLRGDVEDTSKPLGKLHALRTKVVEGRGQGRRHASTRRSMPSAATATRANHSATHLLHAALRNRLGGHVTQKGSLVAPDRLRFDFSHPKALTPEEIAAVEAEVNAEIRANEPVTTRLMTPDDAIAAGAMALFGEKYGDEVRVLSMGRDDDSRLFGRAVRRHPCRRDRRHRHASRSSPKARSPRACAASRR